MPRKTMNVQEIVETANFRLRTADDSPEFRQGLCSLVEHVLLKTDNYHGFRYLDANDVQNGDAVAIGITRAEDGSPEFPDETRRQYYLR